MEKTRILIPMPRYGFDPTEVGVPALILKQAGLTLCFATPNGKTAQADQKMLTGEGLGILRPFLMADQKGVQAFREIERSTDFLQPIAYSEIQEENYLGLFLPGGHDKGMIEYLESKVLQSHIVRFFEKKKPVAAICHGTLLAARSISPKTGKSVLYGRKTTGLTLWQETIAYQVTRLYLGDYYQTYPGVPMETDLKSYLRSESDFERGPGLPIPLVRDSMKNLKAGFVVMDGGNYLSARWPGDAHRLGVEFSKMLSS